MALSKSRTSNKEKETKTQEELLWDQFYKSKSKKKWYQILDQLVELRKRKSTRKKG